MYIATWLGTASFRLTRDSLDEGIHALMDRTTTTAAAAAEKSLVKRPLTKWLGDSGPVTFRWALAGQPDNSG